MKRWKHAFVLLLFCIFYGFVSLYSAYVALSRTQNDTGPGPVKLHNRSPYQGVNSTPGVREFAILDTCGLGIYLWKNILGGEITRYNLNNNWIQSTLEIKNFVIRYNLGYGLTPDQSLVPTQPNIVLVINARSEQLVPNAKSWLDHVLKSAYIDKIAIMLLGSESCNNDWLQPYLQQKRIKCVFIVYDSPLVDDEFVYQWPLGVASYRNFPNFNQEFLDLTAPRKYVFNFIGTVYEDSTRVGMMNAVHKIKNSTKKYIKTRDEWLPEENAESMADYQHVLLESDLTLSPAGRTSECYRTYESLELGSIPIIEDVMTEGTCDYTTDGANITSPYRLLKRYNAPVIYVKDWDTELPDIIREFDDMPHRAKVSSRINLIRWYVDFKNALREKFLAVIGNKFFGN